MKEGKGLFGGGNSDSSESGGQVWTRLYLVDLRIRIQHGPILLPGLRSEVKSSGKPEGVRGICFTADNRQLLIGTRQGWMHVVDLETKAIQKSWKAHGGSNMPV